MIRFKFLRLVICVLISVVILTGCFNLTDENHRIYINRKEIAKEHAESLIESIQTNNIDSIADLFNQEIQSSEPNLNKNINNLYDYMDGNIVSYDSISMVDGYSMREGQYVDIHINTEIRGIKTDTDNWYSIEINDFLIYSEDVDQEGAKSILIFHKKDINSGPENIIDCYSVGSGEITDFNGVFL